MCNRVRASFEFRETKLRWNLCNNLARFKPIYNTVPRRKVADVLAIARTGARPKQIGRRAAARNDRIEASRLFEG